MKKSEKVLLGVFAVLFLALVGGGGGMMAFKNYLEVATRWNPCATVSPT
jgi:hypothetical protein